MSDITALRGAKGRQNARKVRANPAGCQGATGTSAEAARFRRILRGRGLNLRHIGGPQGAIVQKVPIRGVWVGTGSKTRNETRPCLLSLHLLNDAIWDYNQALTGCAMEARMASESEGQLSTIERVALVAGRLANGPQVSKKVQYPFLRRLAYRWMLPALSRRTYADNIDWLIAPPSDRGVLFACNHRSFFDLYQLICALYRRGAAWPRNLCFPVRSEFFYDQPLGIAVNFAIGGGVMYPPIFREANRRALNEEAISHICEVLNLPNSMVGIHPEGTRNQGDPYTLLPAQPGIGQIVLRSKPLVVPVFVNGLSNDFVGAVRASYQPRAKRDHSVILVFGEPVDYEEFTKSKPRAALYKRCADKVHLAITACGEREKLLRRQIERGEIGAEDAQWLHHRRR